MALSETANSGGGGLWWSSWISSAREKSVNALNATKRDLTEFVSVLGTDTKAAVKEASENIKVMVVQPPENSTEEEEEEGRKNLRNRSTPSVEVQVAAPYDRCQAELFAVQNSPETYLQDPSQGGERGFEEWKSSFDIQSYQDDISSLLVSCSHVRSKHSQLVPAKVSYEAFWTRYFYRMKLLAKEEKQRADLMARASNRSQEQLQWDEEIEDVLSSPLVFKVDSCTHQRSESSTDSFVCVSEETGLEGDVPPLRDVVDTESWEHLGSELGGSGSRDSRAKLSELGEVVAEEEEKEGEGEKGEKGESSGDILERERQSLLRSIELITRSTSKDEQSGKEKEEEEDSDWENWED